MLDTEPIYWRAWQKAGTELGFHIDDAFYVTLIGKTNAFAKTALRERFGERFPLADFEKRWEGLWREEVEQRGIPVKPGLAELMAYLAERRIPIAVATSTVSQYAIFSLQAAGLDPGAFAHLVTGEQVQRSKPAPDIYLEAARRLEVEPHRTMAIKDSDAGVLSASSARMRCVMVLDLKPPSDAALAAAFRVFGSLGEVLAMLRTSDLR